MKLIKKFPDLYTCKVAIIGLGYVGLPLAVLISQKQKCCLTKRSLNRYVVGFDINKKRIEQLKKYDDLTLEVNREELKDLKNISFVDEVDQLVDSDVFIVTVPTPVDINNNPDLSFTLNACSNLGILLAKRKDLKKDTFPIIIFESTVFPYATEEVFVPVIEKKSNLKLNVDFYCGYSPERVNPGDKKRKINSIIKVTSGSNNESAQWIDNFYGSFIDAGTFQAKSIKVAEAAKIIENTQRDLNIALINELSRIFNNLNIDTLDVLDAASTKWNFLNFRPGLVGGHCIGVDPYYLTFKSQLEGYYPELILSGRKINNEMPVWIVNQIIKKATLLGFCIKDCPILILGITFKENCPDIRNSKVFDLIKELSIYSSNIDVVDPIVNIEKFEEKNDFQVFSDIPIKKYSIMIIAVAHNTFLNYSNETWESICLETNLIFDLKGILPSKFNPLRP